MQSFLLILDCACNAEGSTSSECDSFGKCDCKNGYAGEKCNSCSDGYFTVEGKCLGISEISIPYLSSVTFCHIFSL